MKPKITPRYNAFRDTRMIKALKEDLGRFFLQQADIHHLAYRLFQMGWRKIDETK